MPEKTGAAVNARIVYWGAAQAGVSTTLRHIFAKLRPDHRGELQEIPTRLDPTVSYEVLPIKLGEVGGVDTRLEIVAVPGAPEQAPTRKQLLDRADGVVFVADARRERIDESVALFAELRRALSSYGRALESVPLVIQINHSDLADRAGLEELARKLEARHAPSFETVATEGTGVLQVLSTISKGVVRSLRKPSEGARAVTKPAPESPAPPPSPIFTAIPAPQEEWPAPIRSRRPPEPPAAAAAPAASSLPRTLEEMTGRLDLAPAPSPLESTRAYTPEPVPAPPIPAPPLPALRVVSVGLGECEDGTTVRLPLEVEDAQGRRFRLTLTLSVGPLLGEPAS
jgi:signal recognition particle receptor subunit beta